MIISRQTATRGVRKGNLLVRQYTPDGVQIADLPRLPRTAREREQAPTVEDDGQQYLILDNVVSQTVDHVAVDW